MRSRGPAVAPLLAALLLTTLLAGCSGSAGDDAETGAGTASSAAEEATTTTAAAPLDVQAELTLACEEQGGELVAPGREGDGFSYCLGPELLTGQAIESATVDVLEGSDWVVNLVFREGPDGIDAFNAIAAECFDGMITCPSRQLAVVVSGRVVTAPAINAPSFDRDQILLSGQFGQDEATAIADAVIATTSFRPVVFSDAATT